MERARIAKNYLSGFEYCEKYNIRIGVRRVQETDKKIRSTHLYFCKVNQ